MDLFRSASTRCFECHAAPTFGNDNFFVTGVPDLDGQPHDAGRAAVSTDGNDGAFKAPTLRNVALSAPYMHNGSIQSLAEVIEHYNAGGLPHKNKSNLIKPLQLSSTEKSDLLAFLISLNDYGFINDERWK